MLHGHTIRIDCIPDGARVFRTPHGLAKFLRPLLLRRASSGKKLREVSLAATAIEGGEVRFVLLCGMALGPGVGPGNLDAEARKLLETATAGSRGEERLRFVSGCAIWLG